MTTLEVQPDGRIFVIDGMPEEPKYCTDMGDTIMLCGNTFCICDSQLKGYRKALASAPRILCADQEQAKRLIKEELEEMEFSRCHTNRGSRDYPIYAVPRIEYTEVKPGLYHVPNVEWEEKYRGPFGDKGMILLIETAVGHAFPGDWAIEKVAILKESKKQEPCETKCGRDECVFECHYPSIKQEESQEESVKSVIADTLYSTGKFPPEVCDEIACVIIRDLTDAQLIITRRKP